MSGSYWSVGDKVNINQTDIEIKCEGADEFNENQVIGIYIPPSIKFFSGKDTTLNFDIDVEYTADETVNRPAKWLIDAVTGANGLFSKCVVYAGNRQTVLETLDHYSSWCSIKYDYDTNDSIRSRRAVSEGCGEWVPYSRGELGTSKSVQNNTLFSQYNKQTNFGVEPTEAITEATTYTRASVSIPIHMGLFGNNDKAVPNVALSGCYLEFTCESYAKVFRLFESVSWTKRTALNPMFHSLDGAGTQWALGSGQTEFFVSKLNMQKDVQHFPFQVGDRLGMKNLNDGTEVTWTNPVIIKSIEQGTATAPVKVTLNIDAGAPAPDVNVNFNVGNGAPNFALYTYQDRTASSLKYKLSNVRAVVRQLDISVYENSMVSRMKEGGVIQFDLPSVACGLTSAQSSDLQATLQVPCEYSKCRSIVAMPSDNDKVYSVAENIQSDDTYAIDTLEFNPKSTAFFTTNYSDRSGTTGIGDYLTSYSWIIDNKIVPSRSVQTNKSSSKDKGANADHLIELEKSLNQSHSTPCRSLSAFKSNFLIGRALTLDPNTVYNGIGKDVRLNARYEGTTPDKNKLWKFFVSHIKTVQIKGDSINVIQ